MKMLQGLSNLNGLTELSGKIDSFIQTADRMEGLIEILDGVEGLVEHVVEIKDTFESLVRRQDRTEAVLKSVIQLLYQGDEEIDSKLKKLQESLGDHA